MQRIFTNCNALICFVFVGAFLFSPKVSAQTHFQIKDWVTGLAYSPDGRLVAVGGLNGRNAYLLDAQTWKVLHILGHRSEGGSELLFSPSGKIVASVANGLDEVAIYFWDVSTGKLVSKLAEHELVNKLSQRLMISAISFSSNGKLLAVGLNWGVVRLLDVQNPSAPAVVNEHFVSFDTGISSVNFAADDSLLVVATGKGVTGPRDFGVLKVFEIQSRREISGFSKFGFVYDLSLSSRGHLIAIAINGGVTLIDTKSWSTLRTLPSRAPKALAFTSAARLLAVGGAYGGLQIWDVANAKLIRTLNLKSVSALAVSPDDGFVLVGSEDGRVRLYPLPRSD